MLLSITCDNLGALDCGAARDIIDRAIKEAIFDTYERGEDDKPRQVMIVLDLKRMDNGLIVAHVEASSKLPRRRSAPTISQVSHVGGSPSLFFQNLCPSDPYQQTIDEAQRANQPAEMEHHHP